MGGFKLASVCLTGEFELMDGRGKLSFRCPLEEIKIKKNQNSNNKNTLENRLITKEEIEQFEISSVPCPYP